MPMHVLNHCGPAKQASKQAAAQRPHIGTIQTLEASSDQPTGPLHTCTGCRLPTCPPCNVSTLSWLLYIAPHSSVAGFGLSSFDNTPGGALKREQVITNAETNNIRETKKSTAQEAVQKVRRDIGPVRSKCRFGCPYVPRAASLP